MSANDLRSEPQSSTDLHVVIEHHPDYDATNGGVVATGEQSDCETIRDARAACFPEADIEHTVKPKSFADEHDLHVVLPRSSDPEHAAHLAEMQSV